MRIAVVQHSLMPAPAQDLEALVVAAARASAAGADVLVLPELPALHDGPLNDELYRRVEEVAPGLAILLPHPEADEAVFAAVREVKGLGRVAVLVGDACIDDKALAAAAAQCPGCAVLAPRAESELQAEAILELALGLSLSLASVIVVVEPDGAALGSPGHGGSAIVHLGQVLAEAVTGDDLLLAEVLAPLGPPEAPQALPSIPPVLGQRAAAHRGRKMDVGYPADLS